MWGSLRIANLEILTLSLFCAVDIALPDECIAIEVDGPHHFTKNTLRPMADIHNRTVLLEHRGWKVVSVPFFSWYGVDEGSRRDFLQGLLAKIRSGNIADDSPRVGESSMEEKVVEQK
jgi:hypothetical protein